MLRVAKPTSPMSVGTWILAALQPGHRAGRGGRAAAGPLARHSRAGCCGGWPGRPALSSAALAPGAGVLHGGAAVADRRARVEHRAPVPAVRVHRLGRGELGRARRWSLVPPAEAGPARTFAAVGAAAELVASRVHGAPDRDGRRGLHHGPGAHAAALVGVPHGGRARGHPAGPAQPAWPPWGRGSRWRPGARCSGSACSRRASRRPATRATSSRRSANGWRRRRSRRGGDRRAPPGGAGAHGGDEDPTRR